ncbi:Membrane protein involved in the export of O-antigen and teichoic acid [hydrothermal vent metagenome]|uniref:Membrane protein involved in the export of O-antigen and teichoic acid n=1 Tax=hydrothermal vent metagenome TaxID=652676 RepID=A0A1W1C360_9ZZZZ
MISQFKNSILFKNTFIYVLLQFINKVIPFLLLPVLTRYLTPEDYGMIATYNTLIGALSIFIGLSMSGAIGISFFHLTKEDLKKYTGNVFNILLISVLIVSIVVILFQSYLSEKLKLPTIWLYVAIVVALMHMITSVNLTLWRSQQKAKPYAFYEVSQTLFNIFLSLFLIIIMHYGWEGRTIGSASAIIIFGILSLVFIYKRDYIVFNYSVEYMKDALKFGITLIPHQMALWMRSGVDILLITSIVGVSQAGLYNVGLQFGMVVSIFAVAFNNAFSPYLYDKLKNITPKIQKHLVKFTYLYFVCIIIFAMGLSTFFIWLIPFFLGKQFQNASEYIYWISLAYAFQGMYFMVVNYIFYAKKNHLLSIVTISTSIFHVVLSYILIQRYGAIGAAYTSVISFFLTFILVWRISSKVVEMPWFDFSWSKK